jgi:hypothetical protein
VLEGGGEGDGGASLDSAVLLIIAKHAEGGAGRVSRHKGCRKAECVTGGLS